MSPNGEKSRMSRFLSVQEWAVFTRRNEALSRARKCLTQALEISKHIRTLIVPDRVRKELAELS